LLAIGTDHVARTGRNDAQAHAGENAGIVGLAIFIFLPFRCTGRNGLPVPINARPLVQFAICSGVASLEDVGFDSGNRRRQMMDWRLRQLMHS
jgi:hypothetical protein